MDKFSLYIIAYHLGPYRFMTNKNFVKEVRIKVEFLELSQKSFTKMKVLKTSTNGELNLIKRPKRPNTKSSKNGWSFGGCFSHNLHGQPWDFNVWTELSELSYKFRRSRCNCSCVTFCTNYKYERDRTLGDRLDSDQFRGGNGPNPSQFVGLISVMLWKGSHATKS